MEDIIKLIDENLEYKSHEIGAEKIKIKVQSRREEVECPFCGKESRKVHSVYKRKFQELPIAGKKVEIEIENRKYFCKNGACENKTFAETFECLPYNGRRSKRLTEEIIERSKNMSSVSASREIGKTLADVGKSTICELLKKR
ncbi:MAG: transposase family protein [Oscillospiraceae bacterium]|nr:transposase family protein [Oscillospiraceae bacterium]